MIVAGESSGELYGSLLAHTLRAMWPEVRLVGMGGERMRDAGVELFSGISSSLGLTETLSSIKKLRESFTKASRILREIAPEIVVLIDYPDFNFRIARIAKRHGVKVLYYVSPQVWAWRKGRVKTMGEIADRVAVILPFEEEIYKKAGIPCEFVGHPVMEEIDALEKTNAQEVEHLRPGSGIHTPTVSLLPGSRPHELKTLFPVFTGFVERFTHKFPGVRFLVPLAQNVEVDQFKESISALEGKGVVFMRGDALKSLVSSDMAVIASGTATLQAALLGTPLVVVYRVSPLTYFIGKSVLDVTHISLVNIIAGKEVVPELIQHEATAKNIVAQSRKILYDDKYRESMISSFRKIRELFSGKQPSRRVAEMIGEMAGWEYGKAGAVSPNNSQRRNA
ncbi:MAG TPA: lipid-A-disaccharide synthase [Thermodesulfovibrionales bacterium]|nr:lipid-A-disaccharide synthase [Thermodesulfovibrionales bacterium]